MVSASFPNPYSSRLASPYSLQLLCKSSCYQYFIFFTTTLLPPWDFKQPGGCDSSGDGDREPCEPVVLDGTVQGEQHSLPPHARENERFAGGEVTGCPALWEKRKGRAGTGTAA